MEGTVDFDYICDISSGIMLFMWFSCCCCCNIMMKNVFLWIFGEGNKRRK